MVITFVDTHSGDVVLREYDWDMPIPQEGSVLELHSGPEQRFVVEEVDWVFVDAPAGEKDDIKVKELKVMVCPASEYGGKDEDGHHRMSDPLCKCGHARSVHAPSRCLGAASTCQCHGFEAMN